jgi:hypothetical protein
LLLPFFVPEVLLASILIILMFATSNNPTIHSYKSYYAITLNLIAFIGIIKIMSDLNKYASRIKALFLIALVIFPLWGTGWQNFWYFDYKVFINYTYLENYLHQNQLKSQKLCPQSNLYPMILASGFATTTFDNSGYYFSKQHDCLMILTKYGNLYPFNLQQVNQQILLFNCSSFKNFYLCTR